MERYYARARSGFSNSEINITYLQSRYFLICKSCFWCASLLNTKEITKCLGCDNDDLLDSAAVVIVLFFVAALASAYKVWVDGRL